MNASYLSNALSKRGIEKGSKADIYIEKAQEEIQEEMLSEAAQNIRRIHESKGEHYKYARTIAKLIFTKIAQAVQNKQPISDVKDEILTLKNAMAALESARASRWAITGLDREPDAGDEIPVLPIEEFTDEEIEQLQRNQEQELGIPEKSIEELQKEIEDVE